MDDRQAKDQSGAVSAQGADEVDARSGATEPQVAQAAASDSPSAQPTASQSVAPGQPRLFTPVFVSIVLVTLFCFVVGQGLNAGTSVYIDCLGGSATLAGIGAAVFSGAAIVGRLVSGPLSDRRGRLITIVAGEVVMLAGVIGAAVSANLDLIMLWRTLQGLGFSAVTTAAATAAADVLPVERLGEGIGYYGLGQALAMSVGPAIAIALVSTDSPENLFWGLSIAALLSFFFCAFCRYERNPQRLPETATYRRLAAAKNESEGSAHEDAGQGNADQHERETGKGRASFISSILEPGALAGGIPHMVISPAFGFGIFFAGLLGTHLGVGNAGLFYTLSAVAMVVVRVSSKAFMDRVLPIKLLAVAVAAGVVGFLMLLVTTLGILPEAVRDIVFYASGIFYGICLGMAMPVNQTVAVKNSAPERWGAANGLFLLMLDVGIGLASIIWGVTNDTLGFSFTICCVIVLIVASLGVAYLTYPPSAKRS